MSQAQSQYEQAMANIPFFEKLIAQQENALSVLLGRNPGPIARGRTIDELMFPAVPAGLPSDILTNRPDIRQAEQNLIAANANIGVAKSLYFPTISLTGLFGWASNDLSDLFHGPAKMWSWAVPATVPIFTAGAIAGQVKSAEAIQQQALFNYEKSIQEAFREVDDALVDQKRTKEQIEAEVRQVEALREYVRLARLRYDNGYASYLEVLYAENSLYGCRTDAHTVTGCALPGPCECLQGHGRRMGGNSRGTDERNSAGRCCGNPGSSRQVIVPVIWGA